MGNDGGSIPKRDDLVRTRQKDEKADKQQQEAARWFFCALSKAILEEPVVSDPLGKLYNKSAAIEYLLHPPAPDGSAHSAFGADGDAVAAHLTSLKDLVTLTLQPNPVASPDSLEGRWICPVSMKAWNGATGRKDAGRWVYIRGCGCVVTESGLKQLRSGQTEPEAACLVCGKAFTKETDTDTVTINPSPEEEDVMKAGLAARRRVEKEEKERRKKEKKDKKRKAEAGVIDAAGSPPEDALGETGASARKAKKAKPRPQEEDRRPAPAPTSKLAALIATEAEKKAANQSAAVASIYGPRDAKGRQLLGKQQESWMTRGTWTRFA